MAKKIKRDLNFRLCELVYKISTAVMDWAGKSLPDEFKMIPPKEYVEEFIEDEKREERKKKKRAEREKQEKK